MNKKLTSWFKPNTTPVREGVYETDSEVEDDEPCFQHWNGSFWGYCSAYPALAKRNAHSRSRYQQPKWRGLAKKP